jgi:hypothetical protein
LSLILSEIGPETLEGCPVRSDWRESEALWACPSRGSEIGCHRGASGWGRGASGSSSDHEPDPPTDTLSAGSPWPKYPSTTSATPPP